MEGVCSAFSHACLAREMQKNREIPEISISMNND